MLGTATWFTLGEKTVTTIFEQQEKVVEAEAEVGSEVMIKDFYESQIKKEEPDAPTSSNTN